MLHMVGSVSSQTPQHIHATECSLLYTGPTRDSSAAPPPPVQKESITPSEIRTSQTRVSVLLEFVCCPVALDDVVLAVGLVAASTLPSGFA